MERETSYWAHFLGKFLEIMAAGLATALSGYLIAQFGGFLAPVSTPKTAEPPTLTRTDSPASTTAASTTASVTPVATSPVPATIGSATASPQGDDATRKPAKVATRNPKSDPKDAKAAVNGSSAASGTRDDKSIEALVRAALANAPSNQPSMPTVTPRAADLQPLTSPVIVRDHPVNAVDQGAPATAGAADSTASTQATPTDSNAAGSGKGHRDDKDLFSVLKRVPDILRPIPPATVGEELRPPAPVGGGE